MVKQIFSNIVFGGKGGAHELKKPITMKNGLRPERPNPINDERKHEKPLLYFCCNIFSMYGTPEGVLKSTFVYVRRLV